MTFSVSSSSEFKRIRDLPRRHWTPELTRKAVHLLTEKLRTETGSMVLKPIQAIALAEAAKAEGGFFPMRVGAGKTLTSFLLPRMFPDARRPLLLIPAALREKTRAEMREYRQHWVLPFIKVESYQTLSTKRMAKFLEDYAPDVIIADEVHFLRNRSAACTKRVMRYMRANPETVFIGMSGTVTKRSIRDFAHLTHIALGDGSPAPDPDNFHVVEQWSRALDVNVNAERRMDPGVLREFNPDNPRIGYRNRMIETLGVVATQDPPLPIDVKITGHMLDTPADMDRHWDRLRGAWETPDGWPCSDPVEIWRHARELALGVYYRWNPRPPADWMAARSAYSSTVRDILSNNKRHLDTELQAREAIRKGLYPHATGILEEWERIAPSFEPNTEHVWISDHALDWIERWAKESPGIVWVDHIAVGKALEARGFPYYAGEGLDAKGRSIEAHKPAQGSCVASIAANSTGRNLQAWNRGLVVGLPGNGSKWEQLMGRFVRPGQKNPCVSFDLLLGCIEDVQSFTKSVADAAYTEEITGQAQILTHADIEDVPSVAEVKGTGGQWNKRN